MNTNDLYGFRRRETRTRKVFDMILQTILNSSAITSSLLIHKKYRTPGQRTLRMNRDVKMFMKNKIPSSFRDASLSPLQKLSVNLITTYTTVNKVYYAKRKQDKSGQKDTASFPQGISADSYPEELDDDPYFVSLYKEAIKNGTETDNTIRVNVVGNFAQGKTSLVRRLAGRSHEGVSSTNSVEVNRCKFCETGDGSLLSFVCKGGLKDSNVDVIDRVISVVRAAKKGESYPAETFAVKSFVQRLPQIDEQPGKRRFSPEEKYLQRDDHAKMKTVDNNTLGVKDNVSAQNVVGEVNKKTFFTQEEMKRFSSRLKQDSKIYDDKESALDLWDFGGQYIFYATHTLFHSRRAIYLLVFDLTMPLDKIVRDEEFPWETGEKSMEYFARFWMNSIHSFVGSDDGLMPPVYLVGTRYDKLVGNSATKVSHCERYFEHVRELFDETNMINHIQPIDFKVDNTHPDDAEMLLLRDEIVRMGRKLSQMAVIPARWLPLERALLQNIELKIISFRQVLDIDAGNEFPLSDVEQVKLFLIYHHAKGTFFYFDEEPISDYVVLDPQYIIDAFKCVITSERFCKKDPALRQLWNLLRKNARLERELIETLWENHSEPEQKFSKHKDILLMFLKRHYIISEATDYDTGNDLGWYYVPSLLKEHSAEETLGNFLRGKRQTAVRFLMSLNSSPVVLVVFHRLLAALLGRWHPVCLPTKEKSVLLFENLCALRLNECNIGLTEIKEGVIELRVVSLCSSLDVDCEIADSFRRFSESVVLNEYRKLRRSFVEHEERPYVPCFRCNHECHGFSGSVSTINLRQLDECNVLPCPDLLDHEVYAKQAKSEWFQEDRIKMSIPAIPLTAQHLGKISQAVGQNWEMLGLELGLTEAQIQHLTLDYSTTAMRIYTMLMTWQDLKKKYANMDTLVQALKNVKAVHVEWDEIHNIIDKIIESIDV